ncbi:MAG: cytochrome c biogenesis protein CcdA [Oligosphaeraceae bacterium]
MRILLLIAFLLAGTRALKAQGDAPFQGKLEILPPSPGEEFLLVRGEIRGPAGGGLLPDALALSTESTGEESGFQVELLEAPPLREDGYYPGEEAHFLWKVTPIPPQPRENLRMDFQGCVDALCYMPQTVSPLGQEAPPKEAVDAREDTLLAPPLYGYANATEFRAWLSGQDNPASPERETNLLERVWQEGGWLLAALLTVGLGFLLNLTPCVLPMIPVTLGVLGARGAGIGRGRGACLGAVYGGTMALTYGVAGAAVVAFGGRFGALQATPVFHFLLAMVFLLLGLSLFDVLLLDFSRFRKVPLSQESRGSLGTAALLGMSTALLAGACIAPVLIWVLLLSAKLYGEGHLLALAFPVLLGMGLGAPWPLLGAGLGFLPKPGRWMTLLRRAMGVVILVCALQAVYQGWQLLRPAPPKGEIWRTDYSAALQEATLFQKPLLLYFWGAACKACHEMEKTTFQEEEVQKKLKGVVCVAVQGDRGEGAKLAEHYNVPGFPTFLLFSPPGNMEF